ncbi:hypothetical protein D3C73_1464930 [compost metagenome]
MINMMYLLVFVVFSFTDLVPLIKEHKKRDVIAFIIMFFLVIALAVFYYSNEIRHSFIYYFFKVFNQKL